MLSLQTELLKTLKTLCLRTLSDKRRREDTDVTGELGSGFELDSEPARSCILASFAGVCGDVVDLFAVAVDLEVT